MNTNWMRLTLGCEKQHMACNSVLDLENVKVRVITE